MAAKINPETGKQTRGFASMSPERRLEIARKGGASVDPTNRSFARNRDLASSAGRLGGLASRGSSRPRSTVEA